jgi:hypothetical protein
MAGLGRPPVGEVDDLASLARLDEKALLEELRTRYNRDAIYVSESSVSFFLRWMVEFMLFSFVCFVSTKRHMWETFW